MFKLFALIVFVLTWVLPHAFGAENQIFTAPIAQQSKFEFFPGEAETGSTISYGYCPCFRWTMRFKALGGKWETKEFLISSDALLKYQGAFTGFNGRTGMQSFTVGAIEALIKGGRVGVGFTGVTFGEDLDHGYGDIFRTGLYFIINLIQSDAFRMKITSGYEFEQLRVNQLPTSSDPKLTRNHFGQKVNFEWTSDNGKGAWRADASALIDFAPAARFRAESTLRARFLKTKDFKFYLGMGLSYEYDPFGIPYGISPDLATGGFFLDIRYQPGR